MRLYLMRHGDSALEGSDNERPLSEQGRSDVQRLANLITPLHLHVATIWHSEKKRAKETAEIMNTAFQSASSMQARPELDPLYSLAPMIKEIHGSEEDMMLVGHMPFMGALVAKLIMNNEYANIVSFKPGTIVCLERISGTGWTILWVLGAELFYSSTDNPNSANPSVR